MRDPLVRLLALGGATLVAVTVPLPAQSPYADRVEIRRTAYGVPHILTRDLGALDCGLAWVQLEDSGFRVVANLIRGLANPARAVATFRSAMDDMMAGFGRWDVTWGEVHRMRRGAVDVPVGGCSGQFDCFRVLGFRPSPDTLWVANRGDAWIRSVEFGRDGPRAFSVLAYGQSDDPASPHFADQAEMFAPGRLKPVAFTEADIARGPVRRYRPGE